MINSKKLLFKNKNFKLAYYARAILREVSFSGWYRFLAKHKLATAGRSDEAIIMDRVNYYNKLDGIGDLSDAAVRIRDFKMPEKTRVYYFDTKEYTRYFSKELRLEMIPGDVVDIPEYPAIVKSRPIAGDNQNSVVLNLDKVRHFNFIKDDIPFRSKKNRLIGRMAAHQQHRKDFLHIYFEHPMCDLGDVLKKNNPAWYKQPISITEHLSYKFILSLEGYDVATNLKWVMSSNSVAVMPKPKYETWFMEGRLEANVHYIQIKDDYSDLQERLQYYIDNPTEAEVIIENAHQYIKQFGNKGREDVIALKVLEKYFGKTK